jgi:mycothiol synthase
MRRVNPLPDGWTTRRPTLDDVPTILEMVQASDLAATGQIDFSAEDVREALTNPHTDPAQDCWLAFDPAGRLMGWAYPDNPSAGPRDFIEVYVHPQGGGPARRPLLDRLLDRVAVRAADFGHDPIVVRAGTIPTETEYVEALTDAGFTFVKRYARMTRPLTDADRTPPPPPDGVLVRPVDPDDDAELRHFHAVIQEAFVDSLDHAPVEYPAWREKLAKLPTVAYDEWFVAEVDGGAWAGVLQSADQSLEQNEGWVKMLAVLRPYRRRGVGATLLRRAFAAYAAKGRTAAGLGVDLANPTAPASLYRAVGLTPAYEADMYERKLAAAGQGAAVRVGRERSSAT